MGGMEFGIALFTGLIGYGAMSFGRRYLAAHRPEASGSLSGVMAMELAPMDWKQWLLGVVLTGGPLVGGHFIRNVPLRSVVQGFGFGAGIATAGKALDDGIAMLTKKTELGALLYAPEVSAQAYIKPQGTGAGALPEGECETCGRSDGLGKCCRSSYTGAPNRMDVRDNPPSVPPAQAQPPIEGPPPVINNMTPRDVPVPPAPPPPPQITGPQTPTFTPPVSQAPSSPVPAQPLPQSPIVGVRGFPSRMSMPNWNWGHQGDN